MGYGPQFITGAGHGFEPIDAVDEAFRESVSDFLIGGAVFHQPEERLGYHLTVVVYDGSISQPFVHDVPE